MGVDYYPCDNCGKTFCDAGDYQAFEHCGHMLCRPCANELGVIDDIDEPADCPFCAGDVATDSELLEFALGKLGMKRETLLVWYRESIPAEEVQDDDEEEVEEDDA